jgi:hypothetical protein
MLADLYEFYKEEQITTSIYNPGQGKKTKCPGTPILPRTPPEALSKTFHKIMLQFLL